MHTHGCTRTRTSNDAQTKGALQQSPGPHNPEVGPGGGIEQVHHVVVTGGVRPRCDRNEGGGGGHGPGPCDGPWAAQVPDVGLAHDVDLLHPVVVVLRHLDDEGGGGEG